MKNKTLLLSLIFTGVGIIAGIILITLHSLSLFSAGINEYLLLALFFVVVWLPFILEKIFKFKFYISLIVFYQIYMTCAILVGSMFGVYKLNDWLDKLSHIACGIFFGLLVYFLIKQRKQNLSPIWMAIFVFSFAMMVGGMWEICEYTFDSLIAGQNTQRYEGLVGREALFDTMFDLICDFIGSLVIAVSVFCYEHKLNKPPKNQEEE